MGSSRKRKYTWYRVISGADACEWEREDAQCRVLIEQEIKKVVIKDLKEGDVVLSHFPGWELGEPEYILPVVRIETHHGIRPPA